MPQKKNQPIIQLRNITKTYHLGTVEVNAVRNVDIDIFPGEFVSIIGPSGAGKSTLLHLIGCLDTPSKGRIMIDGSDISMMNDTELTLFRKNTIGFVFQFFNLIPTLTALENIVISRMFDRDSHMEQAEELLVRVGLSERMNHRPTELSGGERQRVAIARALINDPKIVLADEPTGNLDTETGLEILTLFKSLHRKHTTFVLITHDPEVGRVANRTFHMRDGQIVSKAQRVESRPARPARPASA